MAVTDGGLYLSRVRDMAAVFGIVQFALDFLMIKYTALTAPPCNFKPLYSRRNDGLTRHLKSQDAYGKGYVQTQKKTVRKSFTASCKHGLAGDVVLNNDVAVVRETEADVSIACFGDGHLYFKSNVSATLGSLDVEVTGSGLVQMKIPIMTPDAIRIGVVALITDNFAADSVKTTLSRTGNIGMDTNKLFLQKLEASVYGSGIYSFATPGSVDMEMLKLSGLGQLRAGSIVARRVEYVNKTLSNIKIKGWWYSRKQGSLLINMEEAEKSSLTF
ncbi:hypothetical protein CCR75_009519 [Bremia lactucae]|uniref:Uncharacterized protein n=1 Tax=Bremia lactucae TaxID=4779 RepID=A0A976FK09_BRELC|nr:hypothetical protein CCR75_009519 [Bremia lactucae]